MIVEHFRESLFRPEYSKSEGQEARDRAVVDLPVHYSIRCGLVGGINRHFLEQGLRV